MRITIVSSYTPRKCGIATYTRDLTEELISQNAAIEIVALENEKKSGNYPPVVKNSIRRDVRSDFKKITEKLNESSSDVVHLQHEFGLFGGEDGEYILRFARELKKPLVTTFHTVLENPRSKQSYIMQELARLSSQVIVMERIARERLISYYHVPRQKIAIIHHGVPQLNGLEKNATVKKLHLMDRFIVLSNNLISRNKGYEYMIQALPEIKKRIPQILFLVVGETHPMVKLSEGESYRKSLIDLVEKLGVSENVRFINEYISLEKLRMYLCAADIYITPYLDPQQITSGTLAYAIGVGKVCISTPFVYASRILSQNRGILVPFQNEDAIASEIIDIYENNTRRIQYEKNAKRFGKRMQWSIVAKKHMGIYQKSTEYISKRLEREAEMIKAIDNRYLNHLTDKIGIWQHALFSAPDKAKGYCTDDNARALIVALDLYNKSPKRKLMEQIKTYVTFLKHAQDENGSFHTFFDEKGSWLDTSDVTDAYGRAMWALGYALRFCRQKAVLTEVKKMFVAGLQQIPAISSLRTAAYTLLGLYYYHSAFAQKKNETAQITPAVLSLANLLLREYQGCASTAWQWFEPKMTYDNFRLPQALFAAYLVTNKKQYKEIGETSYAFLLKQSFNTVGNYYDFIGEKGWFMRGKKKALYDQQPLEAAGAVKAAIFAYFATKNKAYLDEAKAAFSWYLGNNRLKSYLIDKTTGGIYDGLSQISINENKGAESVITYLMAQLSLQSVLYESKN